MGVFLYHKVSSFVILILSNETKKECRNFCKFSFFFYPIIQNNFESHHNHNNQPVHCQSPYNDLVLFQE